MNEALLRSLEGKLHKLSVPGTESGSKLPQDIFEDSILTYIDSSATIPTERFTHLSDILHADRPVILACKNNGFWRAVEKPDSNHEQSVNFVHTRTRSSNNSNTSDNSVYGSPLKLDKIADLSITDDDAIVPVTTGKQVLDFAMRHQAARKLVSLYSILLTSGYDLTKTQVPTLLAICSAQNLRSVSVLGLKPLTDPQNNFLGVKLIEIQSKPMMEKSNLVKLNPDFAASHVTCRAKYEILADSGLTHNPELQNSIQLELEWKKCSSVSAGLLHEPPMKANSVAKIQRPSGSPDSPLYAVYQVLLNVIIVMTFISFLKPFIKFCKCAF